MGEYKGEYSFIILSIILIDIYILIFGFFGNSYARVRNCVFAIIEIAFLRF